MNWRVVLDWLFPDSYRRAYRDGFMQGFFVGALTLLLLLGIGMTLEAIRR